MNYIAVAIFTVLFINFLFFSSFVYTKLGSKMFVCGLTIKVFTLLFFVDCLVFVILTHTNTIEILCFCLVFYEKKNGRQEKFIWFSIFFFFFKYIHSFIHFKWLCHIAFNILILFVCVTYSKGMSIWNIFNRETLILFVIKLFISYYSVNLSIIMA